MRNLDIGTQTEEYIAGFACLALLTPNPAIAKVRDGADTIIQRNALSATGLIRALLALCVADLDIGQRKVVPSSSATLAAADRASASVQPLSVVLARKPWLRVL